MTDQVNDFMKDYQAMAQQSWERWMRGMQPPAPASAAHPFFGMPSDGSTGHDTLERAMAGLQGYMNWMQGAAAAGSAGKQDDWSQSWQPWLSGAGQPLAQAFGAIDGVGAESFIQQMQSWARASQQGIFHPFGDQQGATPSFGLNREEQMQQQLLADAMRAAWQASSRYQALIQQAGNQGMERFQRKLAEHADPGREIDSLKALYDLWVDASEEAYAEMANSGEFREAYGEMVNTQMAARGLQQKQVENLCRLMGVPTRSEVSSLGERLQQVRRDCRAMAEKLQGQSEEMARSRHELDALRQKLAAAEKRAEPGRPSVPVARKPPAPKRPSAAAKASRASALVTKKSPAAKAAASKGSAVRKRAATRRSAPASAASTRKRG